MFKKQFFRINATSLIAIGSLLLGLNSLVSCGHKSKKATFATFLAAAEATSAAAIVNNANPEAIAWHKVKLNDLFKQGKPVIIGETITQQIYAGSIGEVAKFEISPSYDYVYRLRYWGCVKQPKFEPDGTWFQFKTLSLMATAEQLLKAARLATNWSSFKWQGQPRLNVWQKSEKAEWDIYGGAGTRDDPLNLMHGRPVVDEVKQTISAIISIKYDDKKGCYDADPIKAIIQYTPHLNYHINLWKFSKIKQIQSIDKYNQIFKNEVIAADDFPDFGSNNWTDESHILDAYHYLYNNQRDFGTIAKITFDSASFVSANDYGITKQIVFNVKASWVNVQFRLRLTFSFVNVNNQRIGYAFNYVFPETDAIIIIDN